MRNHFITQQHMTGILAIVCSILYYYWEEEKLELMQYMERKTATVSSDFHVRFGPQFQEKVSTTLKNRLTAAHLKGSPEELADCVDSDKREYLPAGITSVTSTAKSFWKAWYSSMIRIW